MGLTINSTGNTVLNDNFDTLKKQCSYTIALAGNPNVGKSTIFNSLTGLHQHTGNWPGKTVSQASGIANYKNKKMLFIDIPGTYSIMSNSEEEEIARNYICFGNPNCTVIVIDATSIERNLNLVFQIKEITSNIIVCVNLLDEAEKKGIKINLKKLSQLLDCPVIGTIARKRKTLNNLLDAIINSETASQNSSPILYSNIIENSIKILLNEVRIIPNLPNHLQRWVCIKLLDGSHEILSNLENKYNFKFSDYPSIKLKLDEAISFLQANNINQNNIKDELVTQIVNTSAKITQEVCIYNKNNYSILDRKIDKILTSKKFGIPIMILFLVFIFWLTIIGSNYPSELLFNLFSVIQTKLLTFFDYLHSPLWLKNMLILGIYQTVTWIISVMLPPMAIFFPLFTFLEDLGFLPRIAFNMDGFFNKAKTNRETNDYNVYGSDKVVINFFENHFGHSNCLFSLIFLTYQY